MIDILPDLSLAKCLRFSLWSAIKEYSLSTAFHYVPLRALPPGSPHRAPIDRDTPFPEPSFVCLSKSPVK